MIARVIAAALAAQFIFAIPSLGAGSDRTSASMAVKNFHAALERGDNNAALALMDPLVLIYEEGRAELSLAEYAAQHIAADVEFAQATTETITREESGELGNMAWVARQGHVTGRFRGKPVDRLTTETIILQNTTQGWRIAHIHWSSRPAH